MFGRLIVIVVIGGVFAVAQEARGESCSFEKTIEPLCQKITEAEKKGAAISFGDSSLPAKEDLATQTADFEKRKTKLTKEEKEKFSRVFKKAQAYSEKVLLDGRSESELTNEESQMLARVRSMKLSDLENAHDSAVCKNEGYLSYGPQTNAIALCPIMSGFSETALVHATAIFIGRGLGTCATSLPKAFTKHEPIKSNLDPLDLRCDTRACSPGGLRSCLVNGSGDRISRAKAPDFTTSYAKEFLASTAKSANLDVAEVIPKMEPTVKALPTCFPAITGDQADSAVADWFGAEVLALALEDREKESAASEKPNDEPLAAMAYFVDDACRFRKRKDISGLYGHPAHSTRFNDVMLKNARLRKQLGCTKEPSAPVDCTLSLKKVPAKNSEAQPTRQ